MNRPEPTPDPPIPPIEVYGRDARDGEIGRSARLLAASVGEGWACRTTYARGPLIVGSNIDGHRVCELRIVDSICVRLAHVDGGRAVAMWINNKAAGAHVWTMCADPECHPDEPEHAMAPPSPISMADLRTLVTDVPHITGGL